MEHTFIIQPIHYTTFENETEQIEQCKQWSLLSDKAVKMKDFYYKRNGESWPCRIIGCADKITAVIQFDNEQLHCIHPSYLKEMQAANYGTRTSSIEPAEEAAAPEPAADTNSKMETQEETPPAEAPKKGKAKKEKLQLPEEKVKMTATVQAFTTVPNNFSDSEDEVVIYEAVSILEPPLALEAAWSSHSATLKKLELEVGDTIAFEAKVVAKKLTKHPVPYKINNPAKIVKSQ